MLHLITGQNGAGKSLRAIYLMHQRHGQGMEVYAHGFRGLRAPFVKDFPDPRRWKELPANAVLFVDEAQQIWRTRSAGRPVPQEIMDLETHRHQGIDIYLITQSPMYLDSHIRPLISSHEHLVSYDKGSARVFRFTECYEDVKSSQLRSRGQFEVWKYPTEHYGDYDSAEVHTVKAKVPWRQRAAKVLFALAGLLLLGGAWWFFWGPEPAPKAVATKARSDAGLFAGFTSTQMPAAGPKRYRDAVEYLSEHSPRVATMPWSMPAMDERGVQADPQLYCMSSRDGHIRSCTCLTEQGTRWEIPVHDCEQIARYGPAYNPFKAPAGAGDRTRKSQDTPAPQSAQAGRVQGSVIGMPPLSSAPDAG